ncbi:MAG TPA: hypothetical protein VL404_05045, partial [Candidatus Eisenbacteria bacterium]|nr:hypothetical protein [Candidatus Eisenbacteria bacterium]
MNPLRRLLQSVRPHASQLTVAFVAMFMNSLLSGLPLIGLIIPFVDTVLAGKPIAVPHEDKVPPFLLDIVYRANALSRWELLNWLIVWTVGLAFFRAIFEYLQSYTMNDVSQRVIR